VRVPTLHIILYTKGPKGRLHPFKRSFLYSFTCTSLIKRPFIVVSRECHCLQKRNSFSLIKLSWF
jgi:hypothetical protein